MVNNVLHIHWIYMMCSMLGCKSLCVYVSLEKCVLAFPVLLYVEAGSVTVNWQVTALGTHDPHCNF